MITRRRQDVIRSERQLASSRLMRSGLTRCRVRCRRTQSRCLLHRRNHCCHSGGEFRSQCGFLRCGFLRFSHGAYGRSQVAEEAGGSPPPPCGMRRRRMVLHVDIELRGGPLVMVLLLLMMWWRLPPPEGGAGSHVQHVAAGQGGRGGEPVLKVSGLITLIVHVEQAIHLIGQRRLLHDGVDWGMLWARPRCGKQG